MDPNSKDIAVPLPEAKQVVPLDGTAPQANPVVPQAVDGQTTSTIPTEPNEPAKVLPNPISGSLQAEQKKEDVKEEQKGMPDTQLEISTRMFDKNNGLLHISLVPPQKGTRKPCVFVCMLDVSGSMGGEASVQTGAESDGFSRLDLVKHSVKTIIHMLTPDDSLAIVSFNGSATVSMGITLMTEKDKKDATNVVEALHHGGSTNIWEALKVSIDLVRNSTVCNGKNTSLLLFTDGEPTDNPPNGIVPTLAEFVKEGPARFTIDTFGYGYNLDSKLLLDIALIQNGIFCYIPDCTMVGTTFVNYLSNSLSTIENTSTIKIETNNVAKLNGLGFEIDKGIIPVGAIQYGQTRDFIIIFPVPDVIFSFKISLSIGGQIISKTIDRIQTEENIKLIQNLSRAKYTHTMVQFLDKKVTNPSTPIKFNNLKKELKKVKDANVEALLRDIESGNENEGQVSKAFETQEWFDKWGKHYMRSLIRAHQLQMCHNFKDPGVQVYGGELFKVLQNQIDTVFCGLPAPKASIQKKPPKGAYKANYVPPAPVQMRSYMNYSSGCFDGEGLVKLSNGLMKKVSELKKGDEIVASDGTKAMVVALVVISINKEIEVVNLNGVKITPWHPILYKGDWKFPRDIKCMEKFNCDFIYNLVLDKHHIVTINNVDLITLGHGKTENDVVKHPYFGTEKVIEDLAKVQGWKEGKILIERFQPLRNSETGLVSNILGY